MEINLVTTTKNEMYKSYGAKDRRSVIEKEREIGRYKNVCDGKETFLLERIFPSVFRLYDTFFLVDRRARKVGINYMENVK